MIGARSEDQKQTVKKVREHISDTEIRIDRLLEELRRMEREEAEAARRAGQSTHSVL